MYLYSWKNTDKRKKNARITDGHIMFSTGQHLNLYDNKGNSFLASRLLSTSLLYRTLLVWFCDGILRGWKRRGLTTFPCVKLASQAGKPSQLTGSLDSAFLSNPSCIELVPIFSSNFPTTLHKMIDNQNLSESITIYYRSLK